jgi:hypothetical protein
VISCTVLLLESNEECGTQFMLFVFKEEYEVKAESFPTRSLLKIRLIMVTGLKFLCKILPCTVYTPFLPTVLLLETSENLLFRDVV